MAKTKSSEEHSGEVRRPGKHGFERVVWDASNVKDFLAALPPRLQQVLMLRLSYGRKMSRRHMGDLLGIAESTVSKHLNAIANRANCGAEELDVIFLARPEWPEVDGPERET